MGASWRRGSAAALLLVAAAALSVLPPPALAGSPSNPEVVDDAGDQDVANGPLVLSGVNDDPMEDVDLLAAFVTEFGNLTRITVQTSSGWTTGSMTLGFQVARGPASLSTSTAMGARFTVYVNGTTVAGVNGTAAATTDGLRIDLPTASLGAVGGDKLAALEVATTRTDPGTLQGIGQDDQTGTDAAGPGRAYTFHRPPAAPKLDLAVLSVGGEPGSFTANGTEAPVPVVLRIANLGIDADAWQLRVASEPPLEDPPVFAEAFTPIAAGATAETTVPISLVGMDEGPIALTFTASSERGAQATATATITLGLPASAPAGDRKVEPAGLTFLTPGAEALGLDDAFGSYGEAFLLALIVLLAILAVFLLLALGRSTTKGEPAAEAPWPAGRSATPAALAGPGGMAETVRASPGRRGAARPAPAEPEPGPDEESLAGFAALMAGQTGAAQDDAAEEPPAGPKPSAAPLPTAAAMARVRIEEVRHTPLEPEVGQAVTTEVLLRNDGPPAALRIALSIDGRPTAERTVQVPGNATKAVELPWKAGAGDNRVRIQAFPA